MSCHRLQYGQYPGTDSWRCRSGKCLRGIKARPSHTYKALKGACVFPQIQHPSAAGWGY